MWFKTNNPLKDGWYWRKCNESDPDPECLQICNGMIIDKQPTDSYGAVWEIYEHQDYNGLWQGPIIPTEE